MKNFLEIIVGLLTAACMFAGIIWRVATVKAALEKEIDSTYDELSNRIFRLENDLKVHLTEYSARKEFLEYHLNSLNEKIEHKFNRCWTEIKQNQAYLSKHGFIPRDQPDL